jgi:ammonia channel protein AmtB
VQRKQTDKAHGQEREKALGVLTVHRMGGVVGYVLKIALEMRRPLGLNEVATQHTNQNQGPKSK